MPPSAAQALLELPIDLIRPGRFQTRRRFAPDALAELAASISANGILQPLVVRGDRVRGYELVAGERRWRAAQLAGLHAVPAIVRNDLDDASADTLGLVENLQRESLSPIETAQGLQALAQRAALTHEQIGAKIGKSRVYVTNFLRLLMLAPAVQQQIDEGRLSPGHGKALAALPERAQLRWAALAAGAGWSVRALERKLSQDSRVPRAPPSDAEWTRLARRLAEQLGYPAQLSPIDAGGELRLRFHSLDELDGLLARIGYRDDG